MSREIPSSDNTILCIHIKHSKPIEVSDFARTISAFGNLYSDYVRRNGNLEDVTKSKLYVERVKEGSIEFHLCEIVSAGLIAFENFNILLDFAVHVKNVFEYFCNGVGNEPEDISTQMCECVYDALEITANDNKGEISVGTIIRGDNSGDIFNNCSFNYYASGSGQNNANKKKNALKQERSAEIINKKVLLSIFQHRAEMGSRSGNKGTIESIDCKPKSIVFDNELLEHQILHTEENPINNGYVVDVIQMYSGGKLQAYKIVKLHKIIDLEE